MRTSYGYDPYRGRSGVRMVLTVLIVVLLILLLLAVGFFFFAQRYVVYYDDGSVHFEFPWTVQAEPTPAAVPTPEQGLVVTHTPTPVPTPEPVILPLPVELTVADLLEGSATQKVRSAGGNIALFTMKDEEGHLAYASQEPWAVYTKVTETDPDLNGAVTAALEAEELYTVARVCCFKDNDTPYFYGRSNGLRASNGNWRDETGSRWFSPAAQGARDYIIGICREVAALGFDEIWLDYCFFPINGRIDNILRNDAYNDGTLTEDLEGFYAQIHDALAQTYPEVKLSFTAAPTMLAGTDNNPSGQTPEQLKAYADKIYLSPAPEGDDYSFILEKLDFSPENVIYFGGTDLPDTAGRVLP